MTAVIVPLPIVTMYTLSFAVLFLRVDVHHILHMLPPLPPPYLSGMVHGYLQPLAPHGLAKSLTTQQLVAVAVRP
jgi:hypothetical protein